MKQAPGGSDQQLTVQIWAQAPVTFSLVQQSPDKAGAEGIHVKARNKQLFASTAGLLFTWRLLLDGAALPIGDMLQQSPNGWHPGGQVAIQPQVTPSWSP